MSTEVEKVLSNLLSLSAEDRIWVGERLLQSVDEPESPEFVDMINRRIAEFEASGHPGIPFEEVFPEEKP